MFKILLQIAKKLNLLIILLVYFIYFILFLCKVDVSYGSIVFAITHIIVFGTLFYSVFRIIFPLKTTKPQTKNTNKTKTTNKKTEDVKVKKETETKTTSIKNTAIKYYEVKQDSRYVFAEYDDRYELFLKTNDGLKYVKTDYKK